MKKKHFWKKYSLVQNLRNRNFWNIVETTIRLNFFFSDVVSKFSACHHPEPCGNVEMAPKEEMYQELYHATYTKFLSLSDEQADSEGLVTFN